MKPNRSRNRSSGNEKPTPEPLALESFLPYRLSVLANTIVKYQKGKLVMAEPPQLPLQADLKMVFEEAAREQILEWWSSAAQEAGANIVEGCEILSIEGEHLGQHADSVELLEELVEDLHGEHDADLGLS